MRNGRKVSVALLALALVGLIGCTATTGRSAGRNIDDASITAAVKAKLAGDHASSIIAIDVDTVSGTVYLSGITPDISSKIRAGHLASEVNGVVRVVNNLQTGTHAAGDAPIESD